VPADDAPWRDPVWLDLTRTLTRVGKAAPTGIDRVELAWARHLLSAAPDLHGLCRTTRGFLLLPPDGVRMLLSAMSDGEAGLGRADLWSRLTGRGERPRHRAEAMLRGFATDRCAPWTLSAMARRGGVKTYLNAGHINHSHKVLGAMRRSGADVIILVHDLIPITHPDLVPPKQPSRFAERIDCVRDTASLVVAVSKETETSLRGHWAGSARMPPVIASRIGIGEAAPRAMRLKPSAGRFLMVGTLEPRKNHALMLEVWTQLARDLSVDAMPRLDILGQPGWRGEEIAQSIRAHPQFGKTLFLDTAASDAALAQAFADADTLLYPTLAEGFGLPPHEALDHGLLPICSDLPVLRAGLGADAVYADTGDVYYWVETIKKRISGTLTAPAERTGTRPEWQDHFGRVSAALAGLRDRAERP
jgi:glycosyltransferase involved in cell wall biosynthesis